MIERHITDRTGLFSGLSVSDREEAETAFRTYEIGPGEEILVEGESDRSMCYIVSGKVAVALAGTTIAELGPDETVGEMALFGSLDRRSATVTTMEECTLLALDEEGLRFLRMRDNPVVRSLESMAMRTIAQRLRDADRRIGAAAEGEDVEHKKRGFLGRIATALGVSGDMPKGAPPSTMHVLKATPGFAGREEPVLAAIAARLEVLAAAQGDVVVHEGEMGEDAYIVAEGRVGVYRAVDSRRSEKVATLGAGHVIGHLALTDEGGRSATVRAIQPTYLLRIPGSAYRELEGSLTPEGRAFRRGMIDAFATQLRLANEHMMRLQARW